VFATFVPENDNSTDTHESDLLVVGFQRNVFTAELFENKLNFMYDVHLQ
jgi:hypothetical protein